MMRQLNNMEIIHVLGERLKTYRLNLNMTQQELAHKAGVSIVTLRNFENGSSSNITLNNLLSLMRYTGLLSGIDNLIPEQPISPYANPARQRARHD